jgi:acetyl-CoA acetyltransferase
MTGVTMSKRVVVAGVGMVPFTTPRNSESYQVMAEAAARKALDDAGVEYPSVQQGYAGYVYGDSTSGQAALYGLGQTGIPILNVNNNCSTGSSALFLARQAIETGAADCVMALGFEQMMRGALGSMWSDRPSAFTRFDDATKALQDWDEVAPMAAQYFGGAGAAYAEKYGMDPKVFAQIAVKARKHAANNPYAVFRDPVSVEEVLASPAIFGPLTRLQCCPPTCGAAAAILCSADFADANGLDGSVVIRAQAMATDFASTFSGDMMTLVGYDMAKAAADQVYEAAGIGPEDIRVVELHDCFTTNELLTYEVLGLTPEGTAEKFIADGDNTYGGRVVTNPSGGLLSKGHPLGATGLAQCAELTWQLRGKADARQVDGLDAALQHNIGLGGTAVVTAYQRAER